MGGGLGHSFSDFFEGLFSGIGATITGLTTGHFDYNTAATRFQNIGSDYADQFHRNPDGTWGQSYLVGRQLSNSEQAEQEQQNQQARQKALQNQYDPTSSWNTGNWQSVAGTTRGLHYGSARGNGGVTPPSQIMSISDPMTKMAISATRGKQRTALNVIGSSLDASASHLLTNPSAQAASEPTSQTNGGGVGVATSNDTNNNQFSK